MTSGLEVGQRNKRFYLAEWIVRVIYDDHLRPAVKFACQLHWVKFPISTGNDGTLLTLHTVCYSSL